MDYEELAGKIRKMTRRSRIYPILRDELMALGYWRRHPRGNPSAGYKKMKEKKG